MPPLRDVRIQTGESHLSNRLHIAVNVATLKQGLVFTKPLDRSIYITQTGVSDWCVDLGMGSLVNTTSIVGRKF